MCIPPESIKTKKLIRLFEVKWGFFPWAPEVYCARRMPIPHWGEWAAYDRMRCNALVCNPSNAPNQMGSLERHVALLELALVKIRLRGPSLDFPGSARTECLARSNSLILGSGRAPSAIVFGESDYFYPLDSGHVQSSEVPPSGESRCRNISRQRQMRVAKLRR